MKKVGILIVTYNRLELLKNGIESIKMQTYNDWDLIVVNNGSTDGTKEWLETQDVILINQENLGGAGGFYTGLKYITEKGYEYCWLMDDDVECFDDALVCLINKAEKLKEFGFLCSRVFSNSGSLMNVPVVEDRTKDGNYASWLDLIDEKLIKVKSATFVSVLIPTINVRKYGLPVREYFIWGDDSEYTLRLSSNCTSYLVYESKVIHKRSVQKILDFFSESNPQRIDNYYYLFRNTYFNCKKYAANKERFTNVVYLVSVFVKSVCKFDKKRFYIMLRVFMSILRFKPVIQYPINKC